MEDAIRSSEMPTRGEWGELVEEWKHRDRLLLDGLSGEPQRSEENLSSDQQAKAILERQIMTCGDVLSLVAAPSIQRRDYFPSVRVLKETVGLLKTNRVKEGIKGVAAEKQRKIPEDAFAETVNALEGEAKLVAQKRRFYAEMRRAEEEKDTKLALMMGILALTAGTPAGAKFAEGFVEEAVSTIEKG